MKKRTQRISAGILAVLVSIAMVGSGLLVFFFSGDDENPTGTSASQTANATAEYQAQKLRIDAMVQQSKVDPENVPLQTALGNEYYNAGVAAQTVAPAEVKANFSKAVEAYQIVLKTNKDPNIIVDMATSAFYSENYDLADKSFKEALAIQPNFINALINYGIFLSQAKQDWAGALNQWQKALPLAQKSSDKEQIHAMISQAESELKTNAANGTTNQNPNPALDNPKGN
ncbi:tetratricopeptide repeat protein [Desulfosporosinus fructosivorans]